jgi:flagellar motor switch protein FliG
VFGLNGKDAPIRPQLRKAAIILSMLGPEQAGSICRCMDTAAAGHLIEALRKLDDVTTLERANLAGQAIEHMQDDNPRPQALADYLTRHVIGRGAGDEAQPEDTARLAAASLARLDQLAPEDLWQVLHDESPQAIAVIMRYLSASNCAALLSRMPQATRKRVTAGLVTSAPPNPLVVHACARAAEAFLQRATEQTDGPADNAGFIARILQEADHQTAQHIQSAIQTHAPQMQDSLDTLVLAFDDLLELPSGDLRTVLQHVSTDHLALALKGIDGAGRRVIFDNLSDRAGAVLREEIELLGEVPVTDARRARREIIRTARELERASEISLRGDDAEIEYVQ